MSRLPASYLARRAVKAEVTPPPPPPTDARLREMERLFLAAFDAFRDDPHGHRRPAAAPGGGRAAKKASRPDCPYLGALARAGYRVRFEQRDDPDVHRRKLPVPAPERALDAWRRVVDAAESGRSVADLIAAEQAAADLGLFIEPDDTISRRAYARLEGR